jgi:hypothetical protein
MNGLLKSIYDVWQSEESMADFVKIHMRLSKFDRTGDASKLVSKMLEQVTGPEIKAVRRDKWDWVCANVEDFALSSQLLLNLQEGTPGINENKLKEKSVAFEEEFKDATDSPFAKKAKFKTEDGERYNLALAHTKNAKILGEVCIGLTSFRVSPVGSTPALADSNNFSQLSIPGLEDLLYAKTYILNKEAILKRINLSTREDGSIVADGLSVPVVSKSGGEIVLSALASRWAANQLLKDWAIDYVVPKYDSLLVVGSGPALLELINTGMVSVHTG